MAPFLGAASCRKRQSRRAGGAGMFGRMSMRYRFRSAVLPLLVGLLLAVVAAACGGGSNGADPLADFGIMTFDDLPEAAPEPTVPALDLREDWILEVGFVHARVVMAESLRRTVRDLAVLAESPGSAPGLEWVVSVHEATLAAEGFFDRTLQTDTPAAMQDKYYDLRRQYVEAVQMAGFGSDRLLGASLVIGPDGRTAAELSAQEREEYDRLLREAEFYLSHAERMNELLVSGYQDLLEGLRLEE